jgi:hypothetical protein
MMKGRSLWAFKLGADSRPNRAHPGRRLSMLTMLTLLLVMIFGGGAGYFMYSEGDLKILGTVLLVVSAAYLFGGSMVRDRQANHE